MENHKGHHLRSRVKSMMKEGPLFLIWGGEEGLDAVSSLYTVSRLVG